MGCPDKFLWAVKNEVLVSGMIVEALLIGMHSTEPYRILRIDHIEKVFELIIEPWLVGWKLVLNWKDD